MSRTLAVLCLPALLLGATSGFTNGSFDEIDPDGKPVGWGVIGSSDYEVRVETKGCRKATCVHLVPQTARSRVLYAQTFDPGELRGSAVQIRGSARLDLEFRQGRASLVFATFRKGHSQPATRLTMPIGEVRWFDFDNYTIIPPDADRAVLSVQAVGGASVFLDSISVRRQRQLESNETTLSRALTGDALENLVAFARLHAIVRFFHPSRGMRAVNWMDHVYDGIASIETAQTPAELALRLQALYAKPAPAVRVFTGADPPPPHKSLKLDENNVDAQVWAMRHVGFGLPRDTEAMGSMITEELAGPSGLAITSLDLGRGVRSLVPLQLVNDKSAPPIRRVFRTRVPDWRKVPAALRGVADRNARLTSVILGWSVIRYFYPYAEEVDPDWDGALRQALEAASIDQSDEEFRMTLQRMLGVLRDGFATASYPAVPRGLRGYELQVIEGKIVITSAAEGSGASPGDELQALNGVDADEIWSRARALQAGSTPQCADLRGLDFVLSGLLQDRNSLKLDRFDGTTRSRTEGFKPSNAISEIERGFFYVDLRRVNNAAFERAAKTLAEAKGIIFDVRGVALATETVLGHLTTRPMPGPQLHVPIVTRPGQFTFQRSGEETVQPRRPQLPAHRVFLADARSAAQSESLLSIVKSEKLAQIVGEPSCGANGYPVRVPLLGDHNIYFNGLKVLSPGGGPLYGTGIAPDVRVPQTRAAVADNRDEVIERALELLKHTQEVEDESNRGTGPNRSH